MQTSTTKGIMSFMQDWNPVFSAATENQVAALEVLVEHGARLERMDKKVSTFVISNCANI